MSRKQLYDARLDLLKDQHAIICDFTDDYVATSWVSVLTDSGTASVGDATAGIMALVASDGTVADNDEAYLKSPNETFKFAQNKPILFEALVQFTEANTDDANVIVGLKDAVAANSILDDGGGPAASYSGVVFFKVDGGTKWQVECSLAGTQVTSQTSSSAGGSAYQRLTIAVEPYSSTNAHVTYFVDGVQCRDNTTNAVIMHDLTYTSATEMQICLGVKNGGANNETLNVDYVFAAQTR